MFTVPLMFGTIRNKIAPGIKLLTFSLVVTLCVRIVL